MYRFMKIFSAFICLLPKGLQYAIGTLLGEIAWLVVPPKRKRLAIGQIYSVILQMILKKLDVLRKLVLHALAV